MTKYIVKAGRVYWRTEGCGTTNNRNEAYRYTIDELRSHKCKHELMPDWSENLVVLIPVED